MLNSYHEEMSILYDRITGDVAPQLKKVDALLQQAKENPPDCRRALTQVCVISAYIKRRGNLILLSKENPSVSPKELEYCLRESLDNLQLNGVYTCLNANVSGKVPLGHICQAYDLYQQVVERLYERLTAALIHLSNGRDGLRLRLQLGCDEPVSSGALSGLTVSAGALTWQLQEEDILLDYVQPETDVPADAWLRANQELTQRNQQLRGSTVSVEQLNAKARLHNQFGKALLATRHFLCSQDETVEMVLGMWEDAIDTLRRGTASPPPENSLQTLHRAARAAGLQLDIHGSIPPRPKTGTLFMYAAMEALTNAVRHAHAECLHFEILETADMDIARFANDGKIPEAPIVEGGGLGSLRRRTELAGGTMAIETAPAFALVLTVPKERSDGA